MTHESFLASISLFSSLDMDERRELLTNRVEPAADLGVERLAGVARHRKRERRYRQHHGPASGSDGLALPRPDHPLGQTERRQLRVHVGAGP